MDESVHRSKAPLASVRQGRYSRHPPRRNERTSIPVASDRVTLSRKAQALFSYMRETARFRDHLYFAADETAAEALGVSRMTVQRAKRELERSGLVTRVTHPKFRKTVCYRLPVTQRRSAASRKTPTRPLRCAPWSSRRARRRVHMTHVYVLELTDGFWYVGSTVNLDHRLEMHFSGEGSVWTKLHHPVRVAETISDLEPEKAKQLERQKVVELARLHGADRVRGGGFTRSSEAKVQPGRASASADRRGRRRRLMERHPERFDGGGIVRKSGEITPVNAGDVLGAVLDQFRLVNIPVASRHKAILGRQIKELLIDGFDAHTLILASAIALKRMEPQNLHFIAGDLVMARGGVRMTRREYEQALQDEMEIGGRA